MSREIKFRVYDKKHKTMGRVIGWFRYEMLEEVGNVVYYVNEKTSLQPTDSERIEIMQSTGIKDKNGKEIYEGDIVSFMFLKTKVERKRGVVFFDVDELCYFIRTSSEWGYNYNLAWHDTEVIGNIYENKDLLEDV